MTTIIHPQDPTTDFLKAIYEDRPALRSDISAHTLSSSIALSSRVLCLGHGVPQGLLGFGRLIINEAHADLFRGQRDNIYIWCNADVYVERNGLKGFATGMFISEAREAYVFNVCATNDEIEASNKLFAKVVRSAIGLPSREIRTRLMDEYRIAGNNVVCYNRQYIYSFE